VERTDSLVVTLHGVTLAYRAEGSVEQRLSAIDRDEETETETACPDTRSPARLRRAGMNTFSGTPPELRSGSGRNPELLLRLKRHGKILDRSACNFTISMIDVPVSLTEI
jgi:hypothetical protein